MTKGIKGSFTLACGSYLVIVLHIKHYYIIITKYKLFLSLLHHIASYYIMIIMTTSLF